MMIAHGLLVAGDMDVRLDVDAWGEQWRTSMVRFARVHLSSLEDAEDVVQDTFLAALSVDPGMLVKVDPRSYLFGILRNKIMDRLRARYRHSREMAVPLVDDLDSLLFDGNDHWLSGVAPASWSAPDAAVESSQFFRVVDVCVNDLPVKPARVFSMKEFLDCEADEICEMLGITKADYWQCMSRARKQIHLCLNQRWFGGSSL